jgi:hypothetical protein
MVRKTLNVSDETHNRLTSLGSYGDSMDEIINKCIDSYEKEHKIK